MVDTPPPQNTPTKAEFDELVGKYNSMAMELAKEKSLRIITEKIAKINSIHAEFKAESTMTPEFLDGVFAGIEFERKHPKSNLAAKENTLPNVPTSGTPKTYNTPDGKAPDSNHPLARRVNFENTTDGGF